MRETLTLALGNEAFRLALVPGDVDGARETLRAAQGELKAYLSNPALSAMGNAFLAGAEMRQHAVDAGSGRVRRGRFAGGYVRALPDSR